MPLVEALSIAAAVIANLRIRERVVEAAQKVREGTSLTRALEATGEFPPMMLHMIASGEKSGELDQMLARTARNQENDLAAIFHRSTPCVPSRQLPAWAVSAKRHVSCTSPTGRSAAS